MDKDTISDDLFVTAVEDSTTTTMYSMNPMSPLQYDITKEQESFNVDDENSSIEVISMEIDREISITYEATSSKFTCTNLEKTSTPHLGTEIDFSLVSKFNKGGLEEPVTTHKQMVSISGVSHILPPTPLPQFIVTPATPPPFGLSSRQRDQQKSFLRPGLEHGLTYYVSEEINLTTRTSLRNRLDAKNILALSYYDVTLSVKIETTTRQSLQNFRNNVSNNKNTIILNNLSGMFLSGLNVIMGPSGSGKTSFLNLLSGRLGSNYQIGGNVLVNGKKFRSSFRTFLGYASQDDILNAQLTVRENIWFSICLRRKDRTSTAEKKNILNELLKDLNLISCENSKVGLLTDHNISGGERKRTAIAMELASGPKLLFLDEPTSKLDSSTSKQLIHTLKRFAENGRTIIMTIHQPSYDIYKMFDTLTLLARGHTIYHGVAQNALDYFSQIGFDCDLHDSPPDFFLDILFGLVKRNATASTTNSLTTNQKSTRHTPSSVSLRHKVLMKAINNNSNLQQIENLKDEVFLQIPHDNVENQLKIPRSDKAFSAELDITTTEGAKSHDDVVELLSNEYLDSQLNAYNLQQLEEIFNLSNSEFFTESAISATISRDFKSYMLEYYHLSHRVFTSTTQLFVLVIMMNLIIGLLFGVLYYHPLQIERPSIQNRLGLFFTLSIYALMVPAMMTAKNFVITEKGLFNHERKSGYYIVSIYFFVRCSVVLISRIFSAIILSVFVYWMSGLERSASKFFTFLLTTFCSGLACDALCLLTATAFKSFDTGRNLLVLYMTVTSVFSGYLMNLNTAFPVLAWLKYLSFTRYCYVGWVVNEFREHKLNPCPLINTPERIKHAKLISSRFFVSDITHRPETCTYYPSDVVLAVGNDQFLLDSPWLNETILLGMSLALFYACYHCMKHM